MKRSAMRSSAAAVAAAAAAAAAAGVFAATPAPPLTPAAAPRIQLVDNETELVTLDPAVAAGVPDGYSFADLITSIQNTVGAADSWFSDAGTDFTEGYYPLALSEELAGFNNLTVGVGNDLLTNGYAVLTASDGNAGFDLENPPQPMDFATGFAEAQSALANIQTDITNALTDFGSGQDYFGLVSLGEIGIDSTNATDAIILGLFDSIPGMTFTA